MDLNNNPYNILGVATNASTEEIKTAYRNAARRFHPDVNPNNPGAIAQFQEITAAYEILIDSGQREKLNQTLAKKNEDDKYQFTLQITPSRKIIETLPESQVIYMLAEARPDSRARHLKEEKETRLNLTLVLDHSNSMSGTRLDKVKIAAHQIIDQLDENDIISVVIFNDRAETIIPATPVNDKASLKAKISIMQASGATAIYSGLSNGVEQNRQYAGPKLVNHIILLTDGNTYGDEEASLELAREVAAEGISISAMGLGQEWNDQFLDELASITGGTCTYINSANAVVRFLNDSVRNLVNAFADRLRISIATDPDIELESAFKLSPHPQPLSIENGYIPLGNLQHDRKVSVLFQLQLPPNIPEGTYSIARLQMSGDILANHNHNFQAISDIQLGVQKDPPPEEPPMPILDALGKLTLYRMQESAKEALATGNIQEATRRLENLASRLLAMGEEDLATQALEEARRVAHTLNLSEKGSKILKFQTRLLLDSSNEDHNS
ncbi:MAG: VWA domain-containing protein [Chloroflexi bacterium]|nr:MAG: VWA domain-containing protein [Chloroflexota bacterium]